MRVTRSEFFLSSLVVARGEARPQEWIALPLPELSKLGASVGTMNQKTYREVILCLGGTELGHPQGVVRVQGGEMLAEWGALVPEPDPAGNVFAPIVGLGFHIKLEFPVIM